MTGLFIASLIATIILFFLYGKSVKAADEEGAKGSMNRAIISTVLYTLVTLVSFAALQLFARALATWVGAS